ncbi:zinc finger CCCH domain-containing protein 38-like isoform X2 [Aristolochia californica]|uniref:zinc finger CCCH domain-containing protein 38-like isoform X2 n=1 Tax=Aristolochia californica TaxID=171875 RepID=UPI0035D7A533
MREEVRRRRSKWDLVAEPNHPTDGALNKEQSEKLGWTSLRSPHAHDSEHLYMESNDSVKSKEGMGRSSWEHMYENKEKGRSGNTHREKISPTAGMHGADEDYSNRKLPSHDSWRERSRSRSPRGNYGRRLRRSPGPDLGFKREPERWTDKSRGGQRGSNVPCKDFIAGRCRRQSQCRYLHDYIDGQKQYDTLPSESRGGSRQEIGDHSGYEAYTDSREPQRDNSRALIPCHDFERGKCQRGSTCKYLHQGANVRYNTTRQWAHDRRETDVSSGHDRRHEHEPRRFSDIPCKYFAEGCCRNGDNCRFSHQGSVHGGSAGSPLDDLWSHNLGTKDRSREGPKWGNNAVDENMPASVLQGCDKKGVNAGSGVEDNQSFDGQRNNFMSDKNLSVSLTWGKRDNGSSRGFPEEATREMNSHSMDREESVRDLQDFVHHQDLNKDMRLPTLPPEAPQIVKVNNDIQTPENHAVNPPALQSFNPPVLNPQIVFSSPVGLSLDLKSYSNTESLPLSDQKVISDKIFEAPAASNVVTSEQVAQLTHLSASLAQIFANGHNLPQLFASLNPPNALPELNSGIHQKQYDPLSDSVEAAKPNVNDQSELSSDNIIEHPPSQESKTPMKTLDPLPLSDELTDGDPHKSCVVEEKPQSVHENPEFQQLLQNTETGIVSEADAPTTEQGQDEKELANNVEDIETEAGTDAEGKRSKDAKGVRMFKFALVEFVKEMLKPTWKEGHMSKEAHKTIVKKVVDKVTSSVRVPNVPQTQEKIDSYLSHSKPKLSKLVQAYVEKYMKS